MAASVVTSSTVVVLWSLIKVLTVSSGRIYSTFDKKETLLAKEEHISTFAWVSNAILAGAA